MPLESQSSKLSKHISYLSAVSPFFVRASGCFCFVLVLLFSCHGGASEHSYEADVLLAAEDGDSQAQYALALLYEYGTDTIERDPEQSVIWLEKAAKAGVAGACLYLGLKYEYGNRVKKDIHKAACWYACAAHKDWPAAQFFLATLYEKGKGVPQSLLKALAWFSLAAEYDYPEAENESSRLRSLLGIEDMADLRKLRKDLLRTGGSPCK
ncbi:Sel1 repeat protein [Desulfocapsa sulfexigens DSM 10523]|uniref:Sel1 repeat protein n=1 Tax=Desulfocapsa sulfexigens (strain DSM 10523 / SB164P1) TaxID=1167006 RepID=M1PJC4_DESSD|nr:Sel1 repeat protein [Desulfocapsa sulfexigens DSM 10523]